ncbi:hypothetical protein BIU96_05005 [Curtobacterium sp. MCBA15_008]|nr:hypothetical protein BIU96_05005 [Curtobacterium sp. MCBA15_008]
MHAVPVSAALLEQAELDKILETLLDVRDLPVVSTSNDLRGEAHAIYRSDRPEHGRRLRVEVLVGKSNRRRNGQVTSDQQRKTPFLKPQTRDKIACRCGGPTGNPVASDSEGQREPPAERSKLTNCFIGALPLRNYLSEQLLSVCVAQWQKRKTFCGQPSEAPPRCEHQRESLAGKERTNLLFAADVVQMHKHRSSPAHFGPPVDRSRKSARRVP